MTTRQRQLIMVAVVLTLGSALRLYEGFYGVPLDQVVWSDMKGYVQTADMIRIDQWSESHFFQAIGFPFVILFLKTQTPDWALSLSLLNCAASILTLVFMWKAAEESFGFRTGLLALLVGSVHLPWIYLTTYALPEAIFTCLLAAGAWAAVRIVKSQALPLIPSLVWGILFICGFWLKSTHAILGPLFVLALVSLRREQAHLLIMALVTPVAAGLALHGALTYDKIGKVRLAASSSGLNFVEGKCPDKHNLDNVGASWMSPLYHQLDLHKQKQWGRPFTESGYYWRQGFRCIKEDPFTLVQSLESIPYLFFGNTTWPLNQRSDAARIRLYELFFAVFLTCGLVVYVRDSLWAFDREIFVVWSLPVLALFLCAYIFKSEMRYRLPFDVWLIPISIKGWTSLLRSSPPDARAHPAGPTHETP